MNKVYLKYIDIDGEHIFCDTQAGWFEMPHLRFIDSLKFKPYPTTVSWSGIEHFLFQPSIMNEYQNENLSQLISHKENNKGTFRAGFKAIDSRQIIHTTCHLENKNGELFGAEIEFDSMNMPIAEFSYPDYNCFFYPFERQNVLFQEIQLLKDRGFQTLQSMELLDGIKTLHRFIRTIEHCELKFQHSTNETEKKQLQQTIDFTQSIVDTIKTEFDKTDLKEKTNSWLNGIANYRYNINLSFVFDLWFRLGQKVESFIEPAICLIENPHCLNKTLLTNLFPNVQFLVN